MDKSIVNSACFYCLFLESWNHQKGSTQRIPLIHANTTSPWCFQSLFLPRNLGWLNKQWQYFTSLRPWFHAEFRCMVSSHFSTGWWASFRTVSSKVCSFQSWSASRALKKTRPYFPFNRDAYFMVYYNPLIHGEYFIPYIPVRTRGPFFIAQLTKLIATEVNET